MIVSFYKAWCIILSLVTSLTLKSAVLKLLTASLTFSPPFPFLCAHVWCTYMCVQCVCVYVRVCIYMGVCVRLEA